MGDESRFRYRRDENSASDGRSPRQERVGTERTTATARSYETTRSYDQRTQDTRAPAQASRADDALAELARLIGDEDPFADFNDLRTPEPEPTRTRARPEAAPAPQFSAPPVERRFDDWQPGRRGQRTPPPGTPTHIAPSAAPAPQQADDWADQTRGNVRQGYGSLSRRPEPQEAPPQEAYEPEQPDYDQPEYTQSHYTQAQPSRQAQRAAPATARDARHNDEAEDDANYAYSARQEQYDDYDDAYDPAYSEDGYMPPHDEDLYEAEPRRRKSRAVLLAIASVLALVVVGVGGFFAYRMMTGSSSTQTAGGQPPVIRAGDAPVKTAGPAPTSSTNSDGQKLIYDRMAGATPGNERVVPREEQPVDVNAAAAAAAANQPAPANGTEPRKVKTMTVRADGTVVTNAAPVPARAGGVAPVAYAPTQNPLPVAAPTPTPVTTAPATASVAPAAAPAPAPAAAPPVSSSAAGGYVVQVASQKSETDAMGSWKILRSRYPQLLGNYEASVKRADLGERGIYYRAQVGPFGTREQANELCQSLRAQGGDCLVQRN
ncbi:hypothetical protein GCM10007301_14270 [Azorhizobium oxalatiphilum]|uniref:SPOR domain-containing protein n=1 Tax=Azorhizobium oxalatiphilum TaxID=980631 RepID=A0A917F7I8_9HYPH|nr:SPOR domain-containing protein [Azorhizobium oxalatiphilum]GGF55763.1 hypothetical protein GCM10007301_14270 [Azorhizobium oxalatiphilum]